MVALASTQMFDAKDVLRLLAVRINAVGYSPASRAGEASSRLRIELTGDSVPSRSSAFTGGVVTSLERTLTMWAVVPFPVCSA